MSQMSIWCRVPGVNENGRSPSKEAPLSCSTVLPVTGSIWYSPELSGLRGQKGPWASQGAAVSHAQTAAI